SFASCSNAESSSTGILRCNAFSASARYMAPLSRYVYPSTPAIRRATLLFPEPAGPSMAIVSLGMNSAVCAIFVPASGSTHGEIGVHFAAPTLNCELATVNLLEPHDVVAAIDVNGFAGDSRTAIRQQECARGTHLRSIYVSFQRGSFGMRFQHLSETGNTARG